MSTPTPTHLGSAHPDTALAVLFGPGQDTPAALAQRLRSADLGQDLGRALDRVPPLTRDTAIRQVTATAAELLDVNLADVVAAGWRSTRTSPAPRGAPWPHPAAPSWSSWPATGSPPTRTRTSACWWTVTRWAPSGSGSRSASA